MRKIVTAAGVLLGLAVACAGTARAECRPSEFCLDGACRAVVACGNIEPTSAATAGGTASNAAAHRATPAPAPVPQPAKSAPRSGPPTPADPALQPAAAHPATHPTQGARTTTQDLREQLQGMSGRRRR